MGWVQARQVTTVSLVSEASFCLAGLLDLLTRLYADTAMVTPPIRNCILPVDLFTLVLLTTVLVMRMMVLVATLPGMVENMDWHCHSASCSLTSVSAPQPNLDSNRVAPVCPSMSSSSMRMASPQGLARDSTCLTVGKSEPCVSASLLPKVRSPTQSLSP